MTGVKQELDEARMLLIKKKKLSLASKSQFRIPVIEPDKNANSKRVTSQE